MFSEIEPLLTRILDGAAAANQLEDDAVDFKREQKSGQDTANDMADAAVCFANATGGTIVLGISDDDLGQSAFRGTQLDPQYLRRRIYDVTHPALDTSVHELFFAGTRLLLIEVREGLEVYSSRQKMPTKRLGDRCEPMTTAEVSRLDDERRGRDWSASTSRRPLTDIDHDALTVLRTFARRSSGGSLSALADAPESDLLSALGLVQDGSTLNRAGAMLLCVPEGGREVLAYQHRVSAGGETDLGRRWNGPLLSAYAELIALLEARIGTTPVNLRSGQQVQIEDYPLAAVREALTNAVMHGDHRDQQPIQVEHSPEAMTIMSPGTLVPGISPDNILTHPPKSRFPALADALRSLGLAERWGQGVDRMFREMIRSGRSAPTVSVRTGERPETIVQLTGGPPNTRVAKFVSELPDRDQNDTDVLLLISYLTAHRTITAATLAKLIQRPDDAAQNLLTRVANDEGAFLEVTAGTKNGRRPTYRLRGSAIAALGPALTYQARRDTDRARKVTDHVREYDTVNNAAVQRLFDVDVYAARDILRDLVDQEVLVRVSTQQRGPAVKYGPGPTFPEKSVRRRN